MKYSLKNRWKFHYKDLKAWKTVWRFLKKLGIKPPYDPAIPLLGIYSEETKIEKDTCIPLFIAALFAIARTWKQPRCPSTDEWIKMLWYIYTMEYYLAIKRKHLSNWRVYLKDNCKAIILKLKTNFFKKEKKRSWRKWCRWWGWGGQESSLLTLQFSTLPSTHQMSPAHHNQTFKFSWMSIASLVCVLGLFSRVWCLVIPWTVTCQAPLPMGFSRPEH